MLFTADEAREQLARMIEVPVCHGCGAENPPIRPASSDVAPSVESGTVAHDGCPRELFESRPSVVQMERPADRFTLRGVRLEAAMRTLIDLSECVAELEARYARSCERAEP